MKKLLFIILLISSCKAKEIIQDIDISVYLSPEHERVYDLYSLKFDIGKDTVREICHTYLKSNYPIEYSIITSEHVSDTIPANNIRDIKEMSTKYGLPIKDITTLLLDYENWLINKME